MDNKELIARLRNIEISAIRGRYDVLGPLPIQTAHKAIAEAADALEAQAEQVAIVKPLEWRYTAEGTNLPRYEADALGQIYIVTFDACASGDISWVVRIFGRWNGHPTIDAAKAAAQADYKCRILSALTLRSADEVSAEERAKVIEAMRKTLEEVRPKDASPASDLIFLLDQFSMRLDTLHTADSLAALERVRAEAKQINAQNLCRALRQAGYLIPLERMELSIAAAIMENEDE